MDHAAEASGQPGDGDRQAIFALTKAFSDDNGRVRQTAREHLVEMGPVAVPALMEALKSPADQVRWEAAKALTEIPDPRAADALVDTLKDSFGIRWLASTALINIGEAALVPLIRGLMANPDAPRLRESAHHVLTALKRAHPANPHIPDLLQALSGQAQAETIPWVGRDILRKMGLIPHS